MQEILSTKNFLRREIPQIVNRLEDEQTRNIYKSSHSEHNFAQLRHRSRSVSKILATMASEKSFSGAFYFAYFESSTARDAQPSFHSARVQHYARIKTNLAHNIGTKTHNSRIFTRATAESGWKKVNFPVWDCVGEWCNFPWAFSREKARGLPTTCSISFQSNCLHFFKFFI